MDINEIPANNKGKLDYAEFIMDNPVDYTGKVFVYVGSTGKITIRPVVLNILDGYEYMLFRTRWGIELITYTGIQAYFNQVILPESDSSYLLPELENELYYGTGNEKIILAGRKMSKRNPITFGLPSVMSCFDAGKCIEYCYAENVNSVYLSTLKFALHNYHIVRTCNLAQLTEKFSNMLVNSNTELLRFDDTGDIISLVEFTALVNATKAHADVTVYTYTKSTAIVWEYLESGGQRKVGRICHEISQEVRTAYVLYSRNKRRYYGMV
jgi:hypothetical protein